MHNNESKKVHAAAQELLTALDWLHEELESHALPEVAARVADYAWEGRGFADQADLLNALHELSSVDEVCGANLMLPGGELLLTNEHKALLRQLVHAAHARMDIDNEEAVRVEGLAALARVAEKTVRMASNPARPHAIKVRKEGHWAFIDAPEALAWLRRRDDFRATHVDSGEDGQPPITDGTALASACKRWRERKAVAITELQRALGWTKAQGKSYEQLEAGRAADQMRRFPPRELLAFAKFVGMPRPADFAREAFHILAAAHADYLADRELAGPKP